MSESKRQALEVLNRLHQDNRIDYSDYSTIYDALTEVEPLRDRDDELEDLWSQFGDIPMDPKTECIEAPFLGWGVGIHREEIWHWFDIRHSKGVAYLLNGNSNTQETSCRAVTLINALIDRMVNDAGGHVREVIEVLLNTGFSPKELTETFHFTQSDVDECMEDEDDAEDNCALGTYDCSGCSIVDTCTREGDGDLAKCHTRVCDMCLNASVDPELTDEDDLSFHTVGRSDNGFRIMVQSGWGKPTQVLFEQWMAGEWHLVGVYEPNYCPNCGRDLKTERAEKKSTDASKKLWGRCGITFRLTEAEYAVASSGDAKAQALIQEKIRQGAFSLDGESYFPKTCHHQPDEWPVKEAVTLEY